MSECHVVDGFKWTLTRELDISAKKIAWKNTEYRSCSSLEGYHMAGSRESSLKQCAGTHCDRLFIYLTIILRIVHVC
jgi:hypothetical protein